MAKEVSTKKTVKRTAPVRLYVKGVFTGFKRGKTTQQENQALITLQNVNDKKAATWYLGKRVAYVYKVKNNVNNTRYRCRWGKVIGTHGSSGVVRVKFSKNLTARAMGSTVRVMLYPNKTV